MTRSLMCLGLCCSSLVLVTAGLALAERPPRNGAAIKISASKQHSRGDLPDISRAGDREPISCQQVDPPKSDRPKGPPADDRDNGTRTGPRHPKGSPHGDRRHAHFERLLVYDAVRRTGGPLELMPLLHVPEVRRELELDDSVFKPKFDAYTAEMQKRIDENRTQAASEPKSGLGELFNKQLQRENKHFLNLLDELTQSQQDELIYLFIQARNYRSLSNQLVVAKMGMSEEEGANLRQEIEQIREQTIDETRDRFRRIFDQGGGREQFEKMVRENQRKMDARIEKKLNDAQRAKFAELRGEKSGAPPEWLVRAVEFPFRPGPPPRPNTQEPPVRK